MSTSRAPAAPGFQSFALSRVLERNIEAAGYREPRPIQIQTIPAALEGRDILGLAQTGTGKTAAFALPILQKLLTHRGRKIPRALVVAPTRELAFQIDGEFRKLSESTRIRSAVIYGGVSDRPQIQLLRRGPDVIVACPGRLLDLLQRREVRLDGIETLVLDEADHMFDMGFLPDVRRILAELPDDRQNLLFAATMPEEIRRLAESVLREPFVAELDHSFPARTIDHAIYPVLESRKQDMLEHLLSSEGFVSAIVFTRTKHRAKRLAQRLDRSGHRSVALQGNMSQSQRDRAMRGFREGRFDTLVATDIAARGIDVDQVSHVINFDVPNTPDAYTHRIGRTGRSERSGQAFTFVTESDREMIQAIERQIGRPLRIESLAGFEDAPALRWSDRESRGRPRREGTGGDSTSGRRRPRSGSRPAKPRRNRTKAPRPSTKARERAETPEKRTSERRDRSSKPVASRTGSRSSNSSRATAGNQRTRQRSRRPTSGLPRRRRRPRRSAG